MHSIPHYVLPKIGVFGLFLFSPLIFVLGMKSHFELPKVLFVQGMSFFLYAVFLLERGFRKEQTFVIPKRLWYSISFVFLVFILSSMTSISPITSLVGGYTRAQGVFFFGSLIVFAHMMSVFFRGRKFRFGFMISAILGLVIVFGTSIIEIQFDHLDSVAKSISIQDKPYSYLPYLSWKGTKYIGRLVGPFGMPNFLAGYFLLSLPVLWMLFRNRSLVVKGGSVVLSLIALYFMLETKSRGSLIVLIAVLSVVLIYLFWRRIQRSKWLKVAGIIVFSACVFTFLRWNLYQLKSSDTEEYYRIVNTFNPIDWKNTERYYTWKNSIETWSHRPILGYGLGTFEISFQRYVAEDDGMLSSLYVDRAHNEILDWLVNTGILGVVSLGVFFVILFQEASLKIGNNALEIRLAQIGIILFFLRASFNVNSSLQYLYLFAFIGILISYISFPKSNGEEERLSKILAFHGILLSIVLSIGCLLWYQADRRVYLASKQATGDVEKGISKDIQRAYSSFQDAQTLAPFVSRYSYETAKFLLDHQSELGDIEMVYREAFDALKRGDYIGVEVASHEYYQGFIARKLVLMNFPYEEDAIEHTKNARTWHQIKYSSQ